MTSELESRIKELEKGRRDTDAENIKRDIKIYELKAEVAKLRRDIDELNAFFQKYRIALEVQGAQHRFHSTSWYKDVKKLEDIVNRDRQKRCIMEFPFLKYGMTKNLKSLFQKGYEKLRNSLIKYPKVLINSLIL